MSKWNVSFNGQLEEICTLQQKNKIKCCKIRTWLIHVISKNRAQITNIYSLIKPPSPMYLTFRWNWKKKKKRKLTGLKCVESVWCLPRNITRNVCALCAQTSSWIACSGINGQLWWEETKWQNIMTWLLQMTIVTFEYAIIWIIQWIFNAVYH